MDENACSFDPVAANDSDCLVDEGQFEPFVIQEPKKLTSPLVFSSPHSGRCYLKSFARASQLDLKTLRRSEDAFVDELFQKVSQIGAPLLRANAPRAYLDLNREPGELDPKLFDGPLPSEANTRSLRVAAGLGIIPRVVSDARDIYPKRLSMAEALTRIDRYYYPYHEALRTLMVRARDKFGYAILIDCHSMPSSTYRTSIRSPIRVEKEPADFVIGDRFGASAAHVIVCSLEDRIKKLGYKVLRNKPYAGGFITESYGQPASGWHAIQIEISRAVYMDEAHLIKNAQFPQVTAHIFDVINGLSHDLGHGFNFSGSLNAAAE